MIEAYLRIFVNYEKNNWTRLLPIAEFTYNNAKNINTDHTPFELNCDYYPRISYQKDIDLYFKSKSAKELSTKL